MPTDSPVKRIAVIGPESSGKSVLCAALAKHFNTVWVKEYAREYLPQIYRSYHPDDITAIYKRQYEIEMLLMTEAEKYIFTDTEFIIAKVWLENSFQQTSVYIETMIREHPYDLYLLTAPDLPWEYDPLRENEGKGNFFFEWYVKLLEQLNYPFRIIDGQHDVRLSKAISHIETFFAIHR